MVSQKEITNLVKDYWKQPSNKYFIVGLFSIVLFISGYKLYTKHNNSLQMQAQRAFFNDISMYNKAKGAKSKSKDALDIDVTLEDVDAAFKNSASQNSSATIAPFFNAYESVVQSELGNGKVARDIWDGVVDSLGASDTSRMSDIYKIKLALMDMDQNVDDGLKRLEALARDAQNKFQDLAYFYLGEYYYSKAQFKQAKESFDKVININPDSDWAKIAKSKMEG
jgi:predicted negative regulator of RcsB-dependent stress response